MRLRLHIRLRHWRGKGIHSPFMYSIVRSVFMARSLTGEQTPLYQEMLEEGIDKRSCIETQNLLSFLGFEKYIIIKGDSVPYSERPVFCIVTSFCDSEVLKSLACALEQRGGVLAVMTPAKNHCKEKLRFPEDMGNCVSVDRGRHIYCFFNNLHKQHYRI